MEVTEHVEALRREGERLAAVAEMADLDTAIPTTRGWSMRDLVRHVGDVHRWARAHVTEQRMRPIGKEELVEIAGPLPGDPDLVAWFRDGHGRLVEALRSADPETRCWSFLPAPTPVAFWARRQAHETGVHRADAQSPAGPEGIEPFAPSVAADGIDELLLGFFADGAGDPSSGVAPSTLLILAEDLQTGWLARLSGPSVRCDDERQAADCVLRGSASDLFLLLWNRRPAGGLTVTGDPAVLEDWRRLAQVHWSRARSPAD